MRICKACPNSIPPKIEIGGKLYLTSQRRTKCLECVPFIPGLRNKKERSLEGGNTPDICRCGNSKKPNLDRCTSCIVNDRRFEIRKKSLAYMGGKCSKCGYEKCSAALEFHHRDPSEKDFGLSGNHTRRWELIQRELDKCILLCSNCHQETHDDIVQQQRVEKKSASLKSELAEGENRCNCGRIYVPNKKQGNSGNRCNTCRTDAARVEFKNKALDLKGGKCQVCGYHKTYRALVFHHIDPSKKDFSLTSRGGIPASHRIEAELEKCILLCHNCHREEHVRLDDIVSTSYAEGLPPVIRKVAKPRVKKIRQPQPTKRPPRETLEKLLWELPSTKIAEMYNVSDKAVEKWAKYYSLTKPPRGYWAKLYAAKL